MGGALKVSRNTNAVSSAPQGWRSPRKAKDSTALASWDKKSRPCSTGETLAVEYVADHAQRPPGLVGRLGVGETGRCSV